MTEKVVLEVGSILADSLTLDTLGSVYVVLLDGPLGWTRSPDLLLTGLLNLLRLEVSLLVDRENCLGVEPWS